MDSHQSAEPWSSCAPTEQTDSAPSTISKEAVRRCPPGCSVPHNGHVLETRCLMWLYWETWNPLKEGMCRSWAPCSSLQLLPGLEVNGFALLCRPHHCHAAPSWGVKADSSFPSLFPLPPPSSSSPSTVTLSSYELSISGILL